MCRHWLRPEVVVVVGVASLSLKQCSVCVREWRGGGVHHLQQLLFYTHCKLPSYVSNNTACIHNSNCLFALLRSLFHSLSLSLSHSLSRKHIHTRIHAQVSPVVCRLSLLLLLRLFGLQLVLLLLQLLPLLRHFVRPLDWFQRFNCVRFFMRSSPPSQSTHCLLTTLSMNVCVCVCSQFDWIT